jgi:hypothetical protein
MISSSRGRLIAVVAAAAVAAGGVVTVKGGRDVGPVTSAGGGGGGNVANLWIDNDGGTCTRSGTPAAYVDAAACSSMQASVAACTAGDTVRMVAGSYGAQTITTNRTSPGCTVIGAGRSTTSIASLASNGDWFSLQQVSIAGGWDFEDIGPGHPDHVALTGVDFTSATGDRIFWDGGSNISLTDSDMGPTDIAADGQEPIYIQGVPNALTNVTFDNLRLHDTTRSSTTAHVESVRIDQGVSGITIKNSTFERDFDNTSTIFITNGTGASADPNNVTLENNFFAQTTGGGSNLKTQDPTIANCNNIRIRYNVFLGTSLLTSCTSATGTTEYKGNIGSRPTDFSASPCPGAFAYSYNILTTGGTCTGTGNVFNASPGLTGDGYHLSGTSPARGAGDPADCPTTDHDGDTRPLPVATTCDAGADEVS